MKDFIVSIWSWMKVNDIPNWISFVVWPILLILWGQRTVKNVPNFQVSLSRGHTDISDQKFDGININFLNNTGSIIYLTNARILNCSKLFQVPITASRDIAENSHELKFPNETNGNFDKRQIVIHTNGDISTCLALREAASDEMLSYKPNSFRGVFQCPKYFSLEYVVMVGNKHYKVRTVY